MKKLTCEVCGSNQLLKDGGVFVCQSCGCSYSIEEVRKMMVEGPVDVSGSTIMVDNSAYVKKYLENARRAKAKEDWEETEKYYNLVEQNDPTNIEAIFYSAYGKAKATLIIDDIYKRQAAFKVLVNCVSIIDDNYEIEDGEQNKVAIESMAADIAEMVTSNFVFTQWKNGYGIVTKTNKQETIDCFKSLVSTFYETMVNIEAKDSQAYMYEATLLALKSYESIVYVNTFGAQIKQQTEALKEFKTAALAAYWAQHKEEKEMLEAELSSLMSQIEKLRAEIENLSPEVLENQISELSKEQYYLSPFKGKEKKALQVRIDALNEQLAKANEVFAAMVPPLQSKLDPLVARAAEIEEELTKSR